MIFCYNLALLTHQMSLVDALHDGCKAKEYEGHVKVHVLWTLWQSAHLRVHLHVLAERGNSVLVNLILGNTFKT